jgi:hypothetical protein
MTGRVYSLPLDPSIRAHRLHDHLPLEHPEYAPSHRRPADCEICVIGVCAPIITEDALPSWQVGHTYSCTRGSRLDICDSEYHADRHA